MKGSHSTRTAILQLDDPAYAAAQEHANNLKIGIFIFGQFFCQVAARAHVIRHG